jgi:hypothetical protein
MINLFKIVYSLTGIAYVWSLPFLAKVGFAEKNATSISGFIANAPATGAMAALSFAPITLMWSYQNYKFNKLFLLKRQINILEISLSLYQFFYSMSYNFGYMLWFIFYNPWLVNSKISEK